MKAGGYVARRTPLERGTSVLKRSYIRRPTLDEVREKQAARRLGDAGNPGKAKAAKPETPRQRLDRLFSLYVRQKHANPQGMVMCVTCQDVRHWKDGMDAGHFVDRNQLAVRYDETNVYPQCRGCNRFNGGENEAMAEHVAYVHGPDHPGLLRAKGRTIVPDFPYARLIAHYEGELRSIKRLEEITI